MVYKMQIVNRTVPGTETTADNPVSLEDSLKTKTQEEILVKYMMSSFMTDMYSSEEECPYSVNNRPEW